jgi:hypothetical protein
VVLGGRELRIPASQTRGERFDDLVLDAVEELEQRLGGRAGGRGVRRRGRAGRPAQDAAVYDGTW